MRFKRDETAWKALRTVCANVRGVIDAALRAHSEEFIAETERFVTDSDQRGFYKHLRGTVGLDGREVRNATEGQCAHSLTVGGFISVPS